MPRIAAGKRDRIVTFYPRERGEGSLGTEIMVDGDPIRAWANVRFGSGQDRREMAQAGSSQTATFRVLSTATLRAATERWEIEFLGARWGIQSIAPIGEAADIEFTATRRGS
ncbi:head-tail adaptor protein [Erythrobacter sp. NE805]|uniref:head-tail adaptor protein n=1 Tax=Erythrobacter sp. NE805 TaxID=3389875 RepID=UPI00396B0BEC